MRFSYTAAARAQSSYRHANSSSIARSRHGGCQAIRLVRGSHGSLAPSYSLAWSSVRGTSSSADISRGWQDGSPWFASVHTNHVVPGRPPARHMRSARSAAAAGGLLALSIQRAAAAAAAAAREQRAESREQRAESSRSSQQSGAAYCTLRRPSCCPLRGPTTHPPTGTCT